MKKVSIAKLFLFFFIFNYANTLAQNCEGYFPSKKGTVLETTMYNDKGKKQGVSTVTLSDIQSSGSKTKYSIHADMKDEKDKPTSTNDYEAYCENNTFFMSMKGMIPAEQLAAWKDMEVSITANDIQFPSNPTPGQKLDDAHLTVSTFMSGVKMPDFTIDITERVVEGVESITTPAGTFECIKVTSKQRIKNIIAYEMHTVEWVSKGTGLVKSETYKGDKRKGYSELTAIH